MPRKQRPFRSHPANHLENRVFDNKLLTTQGKFSHYVIQSFLAMVTVMMVLLVLNPLTEGIIVAAIGASAFIVFALPEQATAQPRNVIGGQLVGVLVGGLCYMLWLSGGFTALFMGSEPFAMVFTVGLAVGLSTFIMAATDTEHPPAAGTAVGIAVAGWSLEIALFIILAVCLLSLVKHLCRNWIIDLL